MATDSEKLDTIIALLTRMAPAPTDVPAYDTPELPVTSVIADGNTVNKDGSIWVTSQGELGPVGTKHQVAYGYISQAKNPEMWAKIQQILGPNFDNWNASRDPWGLYKADPRAVIFSGTADALNLSYLLVPFSSHPQ